MDTDKYIFHAKSPMIYVNPKFKFKYMWENGGSVKNVEKGRTEISEEKLETK